MLGGGARGNLASLAILRPIAAVALGYALWGIQRRHIARYRFLYLMAAALSALVLIHLVPLPASLWAMLPGRGLIVEIDHVAGLGAVWRPISLVPSGAWNALFALIPPLAALALASRLDRTERFALLALLIMFGLISAFLGVLQLSGTNDGLYFYEVTNRGSSVGLFANRNHQAIFLACLLPLLAAFGFAEKPDSRIRAIRTGLALVAIVFLVPLILVTGSRAGLIAMVIGLASIPALYRSAARIPAGRAALLGVAAIVALAVAVMLAAVALGRAEALDRLVRLTSSEDMRFRSWKPILTMAWAYFPIGSGIGSFPEVFQAGEPYDFLDLQLFNHAHNDWLEAAMTAGLPAILLLAIAATAFVRAALRWSRERAGNVKLLANTGLWIILMLAIASITDYPLRVPSLSCLFVVVAIWAYPRQTDGLPNKDV